MAFLQFPDELMVEVGKNLAPPDLYHLGLTNLRLKRIFLDNLPNSIFEDRPRATEFGAKMIWFYAGKNDKSKILALVKKGILEVVGPTFLHGGILYQSLAALRAVIECNIGLKNLTVHGFSPLAVAVAIGRDDVLSVLAAHPEVDLNYRHPHRNWTVMHLACLWKHPGVLRPPVQNPSPDLPTSDPDRSVALETATRTPYHQMCVVRALLASHRLDVNASVDGYTALHIAVATTQWGGPQLLEQLLHDNRVNKNPRDSFGRTPLNIAASFGTFDAVNMLLCHGADVNMQSDPIGLDGGGWTPLHSAAHHGHEDVVRLLACHPLTDLNRGGALGETALDLALAAGHVAVASMLISMEGIKMPFVFVNSDNRYTFMAPYSDDIKRLLSEYYGGEESEAG